LFSKVLSLQGLGGIYCPFTGEANINMDMPDSSIPFVICHEMAHQRGFAREDEANFIGYLASMENPDAEFKYSGSISALNYAMNALYDKNKEKFSALREKFSGEVNRDLKARNVYWKSYDGIVNKISDAANDTYLKVNRQKDGNESYGRMVDLLIYHNRQQKLIK
jgi:predicted aminopeptidase